jgi:segregation and condensation protein A
MTNPKIELSAQAPAAESVEAGSRTAVAGHLDFSACLENFQGPLDLLLFLIKESEIEITAVSLSVIVDQYVRFIDKAQELDLHVAGEFLVMAATLLEIKSRELLPPDQAAPDDDEAVEDPRSELIRRLLAYRRLKDQARDLELRAEARAMRFTRGMPDVLPDEEPAETSNDDLKDVDLYALFAAFERVLKAIAAATPRLLTTDSEPIEAKIVRIENILREKPFARFIELVAKPESRADIAGTFVALLELVRRRAIRLRQAGDFGAIDVQSVEQAQAEAEAKAEAETAEADAEKAREEKKARDEEARLARQANWRKPDAEQNEKAFQAPAAFQPDAQSVLQIEQTEAPEAGAEAAAENAPTDGRRRKARPRFEGVTLPEDLEEFDAEEREIARRLDVILAAAEQVVARFEAARDGKNIPVDKSVPLLPVGNGPNETAGGQEASQPGASEGPDSVPDETRNVSDAEKPLEATPTAQADATTPLSSTDSERPETIAAEGDGGQSGNCRT